MSRTSLTQAQLQSVLYSINPITNLPYAADQFKVADGQGNLRWQGVFDTISSQSSTDGAPLGYLPSTIYGISNDTSTFTEIVTTSYSTLSTQIGEGGIPGSVTGLQLQSTTAWIIDPVRYISSGHLISSMTPFFNGSLSFMSNIQSTTIGLGSAGYVSSTQLVSTTDGVNRLTTSTLIGAASAGYVSSTQLASTTAGLGTAGYISTTALFSTVTGMLYPATEAGGSLGAVVTGPYTAPFKNFYTLLGDYNLSTFNVTSTNAAFYGLVFRNNLASTTAGLGTTGYVSTATLLSTSAGIQEATQNIFVDRSGTVQINNSQVYISSVGAITFLSSFVNSTITYKGQNGDLSGVETNNADLTFSTANLQLDTFSSLITPSSRLTVELYPTFQFDRITEGADKSKVYPMFTYLQYGGAWLSTVHETQVAGVSATPGFSNIFQQPIKMSLAGSAISGNYTHPYVLHHFLPSSLSYNLNVGFRDSNLTVFFASTNSYFLSVQNLTF
jgi:hypothetical protein